MRKVYGTRYLNKRPTPQEMERLSERYAEVGFQGFVGCVYCMKLQCKNCRIELKGQYRSSREGKLATLQVEA